MTGQYFSNEAGDPGTIAFPNAQARKRNRNGLLGLAYDEMWEGVVQTLHVQSFYHNLLFNYEDPLAWVPILNNSHNIAAGGEVQTGLRMAGWNSMTVGYAYRWDHYTGTSLQGEYERGLNSAYVVDEVAVRPDFLKGIHRIAIVPALRWDRFSDFGAQVRALSDIGYSGPVILECSAPGPDPFAAIKGEDSVAWLETYLRESRDWLAAAVW